MEAGIEEIVAEFTKGTYGHYTDAVYSNLAMTKRVLPDFRRRTAHLYQPVAATAGADRGQSRTGVWYPSGVDLSVSGTGIFTFDVGAPDAATRARDVPPRTRSRSGPSSGRS